MVELNKMVIVMLRNMKMVELIQMVTVLKKKLTMVKEKEVKKTAGDWWNPVYIVILLRL